MDHMARLNNFATRNTPPPPHPPPLSEAELYFPVFGLTHNLYYKNYLVLTNHLHKEEQFAEY